MNLVTKSGIALAAMLAALGAAEAYDNCTPQVHIVYAGATAPNPSLNQAATNLYGAPLSTCPDNQTKTYRGMADTDGDGTKDTCVQLYISNNFGSCEGVEDLDLKLGNFNVCQPTAGSTTLVKANTLKDQNNNALYANLNGSDVDASLCDPVINSNKGRTRPQIFADSETKAFVVPFSLVINSAIRTILPASRVVAPGVACPSGYADCPRVKFGVTKDQLKGIFGTNQYCDWRNIDSGITSATGRAIGTVMRNRLSGTRRNFNATMLETVQPGQGNIYESGTGTLLSRVSSNDWCVSKPGECGENQTTGAIGGGSTPCASIGSQISMGMASTDRLKMIDPGTPADPFDDYGVKGAATDSYDVLEYNGQVFNKPNVQCGYYDYWSYERLYFDTQYFPAGSTGEAAVLQYVQATSDNAVNDTNVVAPSQMYFSRGRDGAPIFPSTAFNAFCKKP